MDVKEREPVRPEDAERRGSTPKGGASRRSVWLVVAVIVVGIVGAGLILQNARSSSPITSAENLYPKGPLTRKTAGAALLKFRPGSVQGTNLASTVGIPIGQAILEATGNSGTLSRFPGRVAVRPDGSGTGFLVSVTLPVRLRFLENTGAIRLGWLPGSSNLKTGALSVTVRAGRVYGIRMNPRTHDAVFTFDLARSDRNVASLNWNASAAIAQTDGSDPFS